MTYSPKYNRESYLTKKKIRKEQGLCLYCGRPKGDDGTTMICRNCADSRSLYYQKRKEQRRCPVCDVSIAPSSKIVRCDACQKVCKDISTKRRNRRHDDGVCITCGNPDILESTRSYSNKYCLVCYLKRVSVGDLGTSAHWEHLLRKLEEQKYCCAYTGERLVLGENASLDHILPSSRFPELASDPTNTEWVTRQVNAMKGNKTREEFLATIRLLANAVK